jgi:hypothetical protein
MAKAKDLPARAAIAIASCLCFGGLGASPSGPTPSGAPPDSLVMERRIVDQDRGAWQVDYRFRNTGPTDRILDPDEIAAKVEGWVSNSRIAAHSLPRWSSVAVAKGAGPTAEGNVIAAAEKGDQCKERLAVSLWPDQPEGCESRPACPGRAASASAKGPVVRLAPGGSARVRIRLEHQHVFHGAYDPLLGVRAVELTIGSSVTRDLVPLDREQRRALPESDLPEVPEDRRDPEWFHSPPDSLHLEAHIPGHQYYRFPDRPVRYDTKMRIRFWYLIARGTEGSCRFRLSQVRDTPNSWRSLSRANFEQCLHVVGRWTKVERIVRTDPEATHVTLDFGIISDVDVGEMWIDDVSFEPVGFSRPGP